MGKTLFELKDIEPQLTEKQIEELKHIIYMAKSTEGQKFRLGEYGRWIVVFPSGKMGFLPKEEKITKTKKMIPKNVPQSKKEIKQIKKETKETSSFLKQFGFDFVDEIKR